MIVKQVIFRCPNTDVVESTKEELGGIALYEGLNEELQSVICGCCGGIFEPDDVEIIRKLEWLSISQEIIGE